MNVEQYSTAITVHHSGTEKVFTIGPTEPSNPFELAGNGSLNFRRHLGSDDTNTEETDGIAFPFSPSAPLPQEGERTPGRRCVANTRRLIDLNQLSANAFMLVQGNMLHGAIQRYLTINIDR